jgi:hypothetical protein
MAGIEPLVSLKQLKTKYLKQFSSELHPIVVKYDPDFDALMILLASPEVETVVHYLDEHVGLIYRADSYEIVGLQVEDFEHSFLPQHDALRKVWRLSDACEELEDMGDLILAVEQRKPEVAREVARATERTLGKPGEALIKALEHAHA